MLKSLLVAASVIAIGTGSALAAGSDSSGTTAPPKQTKTSKDCKKTEIWDKETKKCVAAEKSSFNDDTLYDAARELAYADRHEDAIAILKVMNEQDTPRVLNYLGFNNRKMGNFELGMDYYRKALAINPDYVLARAYMGQALMQQGDIDGAKEQLTEIRRRVGTQDYAYFALAQALKTNQAY